MFFDFFLATVFLASAAILWYRISVKIPELVAVSDTVIVERLHEDSARVRIFLLHFRVFYREGRHWIWLWKFSEKICYRAHIFLLRADNAVVAVLQKIRSAGNGISASTVNGDAPGNLSQKTLNAADGYWHKLRQERGAGEASNAQAPSLYRPVWQGMGRIQEVRAQKKDKTPK